jgi:hypothetical protein
MKVVAGSDPSGRCFAKTRPTFRSSSAQPHPYPKDGVNDHVVNGSDSQSRSTRHEDGVLVPRCSRSRETVELRLRLARNAPGKAMDLGDAFIQSELIESAKPITCRGTRGVSPRAWHVQAELVDISPAGEPIPALLSFRRDGRSLAPNLAIGIIDFGHNSSRNRNLDHPMLARKERSMDAHERPVVTEENKVAMRAGSTGHHVRYILIGSIALAILAWILVEMFVRQ